MRTPFGLQQRYWGGIERVAETPDHVFIYSGVHSAFIVSKSWLGESVTALRDCLERGMKPAAAA